MELHQAKASILLSGAKKGLDFSVSTILIFQQKKQNLYKLCQNEVIYLSIFFLKISHNYGGSYILKLIKLHTGPLLPLLLHFKARIGQPKTNYLFKQNKFVFSKLIFKQVRFIKIALGTTHIEAAHAIIHLCFLLNW